jgi:hypothetical protein
MSRHADISDNVQWMLRKLKDLQQKRHPVDGEAQKDLSPCRQERINRLGRLAAGSATPGAAARSDHRSRIQTSSLGQDVGAF